MEIKEGLKYTESHEWIRTEGNIAYIGITDYAQEALGDIVYVEIPESGREVNKGDEVLNIESVKVAEAVYSPVSGRIQDVNSEVEDKPEALNQDPYKTYLYSIEMTDTSELSSCLDAAEYKNLVETS